MKVRMSRVLMILITLWLALPGLALAGEPAADSMVPRDLNPSLRLFTRGDVFFEAGGLLQMQLAPYVGSRALLTNNDPASEAGFRMRRARLAFSGGLTKKLTFHMELNLLSGTDSSHLLYDARLQLALFPQLVINAGTSKAPYAWSELRSSQSLPFIERTLSARMLAPGNVLGVSLEGKLAKGLFRYIAGVYNSTPGLYKGNESGGVLTGLRLELHLPCPCKKHSENKFKFRLGAGGYYADGPTSKAAAVSADLHLRYKRFSFFGEFLWDWRSPKGDPLVASTLPGEVTRLGAVGEVVVVLIPNLMELALRYEYYDNNTSFEDLHDQWLATGGLNFYFFKKRIKVLVNYIHREEIHGSQISNDIAFIQLQGAF